MLDWMNFFFFLFFLCVFFLLHISNNFLNLFFLGEFFWCMLYSMFLELGIFLDDINLLSFSFFILAFAAAEYSVGFMLLTNFKKFKESYFFKKDEKNISLEKKKEFFFKMNSFFWTK